MQKFLATVLLIVLVLVVNGCAASRMPSIVDELHPTPDTRHPTPIPTQLTDVGIFLYGEKILAAWGLRSEKTNAYDIGGSIALAALSTTALAVSGGGGASRDATSGLIAGFNFLLQVMGIIKPGERNEARNEGAEAIIEARGAFLKALAAKKIYRISNTRFTPQGALYFDQIGAAIQVVNKLIVGLRPRVKDLQALEPVPPELQPDPEPE